MAATCLKKISSYGPASLLKTWICFWWINNGFMNWANYNIWFNLNFTQFTNFFIVVLFAYLNLQIFVTNTCSLNVKLSLSLINT